LEKKHMIEVIQWMQTLSFPDGLKRIWGGEQTQILAES
jgi:hypothetical protein